MKTSRKIRNIMNRNSLITTLTAGFIIISFGLSAQPLLAKDRGFFGPPTFPDEIVQTLTDRLGLTTDQVEAIRPIIEEKVHKMNEIRDRRGSDRQAFRLEMQRIRWYTEIKLGEILTDEQVDAYLALKQEQRDRFRQGRHRGGWMRRGFNKTPEQVIERLRTRLDLTGEQEIAIKPIIEESIEKRREIFDKYSDQRQNVRQSMRDEMQAIGDETHERIATILTDEQIEELNVIKEENRARINKRMDAPGKWGFN